MSEKAILLRDSSEESEKAEKELKQSQIEHVQLFVNSGHLPSILTPDSAYAYEGLDGVRLFVRQEKKK